MSLFILFFLNIIITFLILFLVFFLVQFFFLKSYLPGFLHLFKVWISSVAVARPTVLEGTKGVLNTQIFPAECRERGITYRGKTQAKLCWRINNGPIQSDIKPLGHIPIMVKVKLSFGCYKL